MQNLKRTILFLCFGFFAYVSFAQRPILYPALKDNLWGFIDAQGNWMIHAIYLKKENTNDTSSVYFVYGKGAPRSLGKYATNLIVLNKFGDTLEIIENYREYSDKTFNLEDFIIKYTYGIVHLDSILKSRKEIYEQIIKEEKIRIERLNEFSTIRDTSKSHNGFQFTFKGIQNIGAWEPINNQYLLMNLGGEMLWKKNNYSGYYTVEGGLWGICDINGNIKTGFTAENKNNININFKNLEDQTGLLPKNNKIQSVSMLNKIDDAFNLKVWNQDFNLVYETGLISAISQFKFNSENNLAYSDNWFNSIILYTKLDKATFLILDTSGNILDTLDDIHGKGNFVFKKKNNIWFWKEIGEDDKVQRQLNADTIEYLEFHDEFYLLKKNEKWTVYSMYNQSIISEFYCDSNVNIEFYEEFYLYKKGKKWIVCSITNHKILSEFFADSMFIMANPYFYYNYTNDTLIINHVKNGKQFRLKGNFLIPLDSTLFIIYHSIDNEYSGQKLFTIYDENGNLKYKDSGYIIHQISKSNVFNICLKDSQIPLFYYKYNRTTHPYPIYKINNFQTDSHFLLLEQNNIYWIIDSAFRKFEILSAYELSENKALRYIDISNGKRVMIYKDSVFEISKNNKNIHLLFSKVSKWDHDSLFLVLKKDGKIYLFLRKTNTIIRIKHQFKYSRIKQFQEILYVRESGSNNWFYINANGKIIYKSPDCKRVKSKKISLKKLVRKW